MQHVFPRFSETDALGHINNTNIPIWFEGAREPLFRIFMPDLNVKKWNLIVAKIQVDFVEQIVFGKSVDIKTYISRIGNSSFDVCQRLYQEDTCKAHGVTVMVHYDFNSKASVSLSASIVDSLNNYLNYDN